MNTKKTRGLINEFFRPRLYGVIPWGAPKIVIEPKIGKIKEKLPDYAGTKVQVTEKLLGNPVMFWEEHRRFRDRLHVCDGHSEIFDKESPVRKLIEPFKKHLDGRFIYQGVIVGEGMRDNWYGLSSMELYVTDVFTKDRERLSPRMAAGAMSAAGLKGAPVVCECRLPSLAEQVISLAKGVTALSYDSRPRKGIIVKSLDDKEGEFVFSFSFQVTNPEYHEKRRGTYV